MTEFSGNDDFVTTQQEANSATDRVREVHDQLWREFGSAGDRSIEQAEAGLGSGIFAEMREQNVLDLELLLHALRTLDVMPAKFFGQALKVGGDAWNGAQDLESLAARAWSGLAGRARQRWEELSGKPAETDWRELDGSVWEQIEPGEMVCRFHLTLDVFLGREGEKRVEQVLGLKPGLLSFWRDNNELELGVLFHMLEVLEVDSVRFLQQAIHGSEVHETWIQFQATGPELEVDLLDLSSPEDLHQLLDAFTLDPQIVWLDRRAEIYSVLRRYSGYIERFRTSIGDLHQLAHQTDDWGAACARHGIDPLAELNKIIGGVHADVDDAWLVFCFLDEVSPRIQLSEELHPLMESYLQLEMFVADKRRLLRPSNPMADWLLEPTPEPVS